jgi:hypothetical protein
MGKQTFYIHLNWTDYPEKTSKIAIPGKWETEKSVSAVMELFVDAYNAKNPDHVLDIESIHLETQSDGQGDKVYSDAIIGDVLENRNDYYIRPGTYKSPTKEELDAAKSASASTTASNEGKLRCRNYGCQKYYTEEENCDTACCHHILPPYFHDTIKGWQCCRDKKAFDWEEFQAIAGCTVSRHSTEDPGQAIALSAREEAGREIAAERAAGASSSSNDGNELPKTVLKSIEQFNIDNPDAASATGTATKMMSAPRKSSRNADGMTARCQRKGCGKTIVVSENNPTACNYHGGQAVFHDAMKYWSCCPDKKKMDFDEFMAVPGCCVGNHDDGLVDLV